MPALNEITPAQLNRLIGIPDSPTILDVRTEEDFDQDPQLIPGAIRYAHTDLPAMVQYLARRSANKTIVYCQKGRKLSHGVAALLRQSGYNTEVLQGGQYGWRDADLPMINSQTPIKRDHNNASRWVTRHRPKIDRIACPWLIRRFIDPDAQFLFVPPQDVTLVAEKFSATPFDIEGAQFSHRGDKCSFDAFLEDFGLQSAALVQMALVVRGADTNAHGLSAQSAGLLAFSTGLSRMYRDDIAQLNAGMLLYDALYRWARDAMEEGHDWPQAR